MISGMLVLSRTKGQSADWNRMVKKYGIPMLITSDDNLKEYISTILAQVQGMSLPPHSNPLHHKGSVGPADNQNGF